ncbi:MAG: hypothetical protein KME10_12775 [Plectolyngbya sp. WJT66-NPBG17]|nr:hypothetical protein [Plectolyngbya sp. WJT66-NPBG17]MBW4528429.1 hypothetical protein [Phormidium tanganyikae FI6-MK23]
MAHRVTSLLSSANGRQSRVFGRANQPSTLSYHRSTTTVCHGVKGITVQALALKRQD